jgi:hypothetical protein
MTHMKNFSELPTKVPPIGSKEPRSPDLDQSQGIIRETLQRKPNPSEVFATLAQTLTGRPGSISARLDRVVERASSLSKEAILEVLQDIAHQTVQADNEISNLFRRYSEQSEQAWQDSFWKYVRELPPSVTEEDARIPFEVRQDRAAGLEGKLRSSEDVKDGRD